MELMKLNIQKFASSGTLGTLSGSYKTTYTVTWSLLSQSTSNNTSTIRLTATLYTGNSTTISSSYSTFVLDGTTVYSGAYSKNGAGNVFVKTKDITVKHNNDGSFPGRSVSFSTNDYVMGNQSGSGTISGVSSIARYPVLTSGQNFTDEENPTLTFTNPAKIYPIRVKLEAGGNTQLITRDIDKSSTSYTFNLTEEERNKLRELATTNSLSVVQTVCAMNGETELSSSYKTYTMTIVNGNPVFNDFVFEDINEQAFALTGDSQSIIAGYSDVKVTIPVANKAVAQKQATMSKYRFNSIDVNYSDTEDVSITSNKVTNGDFTVYAIDSRGNSKSVTKNATNVINYIPLSKGNISAIRENGVSENVLLQLDGQLDIVNFGTTTNSIISAQYRYKIAGSSDDKWSDEFNLDLNIDEEGNFNFEGLIKGDTEALGFNISNAYNIEVIIEDKLSKITYTTNLGSGIPHIAYAKNGIGIMGAYDESVGGLLQVGGKKINNNREIMTAYLSANTTISSTSAWSAPIIPLDGNISYNQKKLEFNSNKIKILEDCKIKVSAVASMYGNNYEKNYIACQLTIDDTSGTGRQHAEAQGRITNDYQYLNLVVAPFITEVFAGETIKIGTAFASATQKVAVQGSSSNLKTYLTVEVIE